LETACDEVTGPLISRPEDEKPVRFKLLKAEGYLHELPDGTIARLTSRAQNVTRTQLGTFKAYGPSELTPISLGAGLTVFQPTIFNYPEKQLHKGQYIFGVADRKEPVSFRPSLKQVERVVGRNGTPYYIPSAVWVSDQGPDFVQTNTWPSTFAKMGGSRDDITAIARRQKLLLEWLFKDSAWFYDERNANHPAYADWRNADRFAKWRGRKPDDMPPEELHFVGRIALNTTLLARLSGGDPSQLTPGTFDAFGDAEVQKKITSRVKDPQLYEDLLVELYTASWHRTKDREALLLETKGFPDVRVSIKSLGYPIYIECKRITVSSVNQIQSDIKDASIKIRRASQGRDSEAYGAALLDFSAVVGLHRQETQAIPPAIEDVKQKVRNAIRGQKNSHVETAVVVWDDYGLVGEEPEQLLVFRRRAELIHHDPARRKLGLEHLFDGYGVRMPLRNIPDELL
jgi:hypothetical protein